MLCITSYLLIFSDRFGSFFEMHENWPNILSQKKYLTSYILSECVVCSPFYSIFQYVNPQTYNNVTYSVVMV